MLDCGGSVGRHRDASASVGAMDPAIRIIDAHSASQNHLGASEAGLLSAREVVECGCDVASLAGAMLEASLQAPHGGWPPEAVR